VHLTEDRGRPLDETLGKALFALGPHIRYAAVANGQYISSAEHENVAVASESSSDFFSRSWS
jgi:hypothetical protein